MWLEIAQDSFEVRQQGLSRRAAASGGEMYVSPGNEDLAGVEALVEAEYCQAVELDHRRRTVSFGRDYLGHYPLASNLR